MNKFFKPKNIEERKLQYEKELEEELKKLRETYILYVNKFENIIEDIKKCKILPKSENEKEVFKLLTFCFLCAELSPFSWLQEQQYIYIYFEYLPTIRKRKNIFVSCNIKEKRFNINNYYIFGNHIKKSSTIEFQNILESLFFADKMEQL